jgi:DnaK suppressor protein
VAKAEAVAADEAKPPAKPAPKKMVIRKPLPKAPPPRKPRPAKLDKDTLQKIKAQLQQERTDLRRQQEELEEDSFEGSQSDLSGEVGLDEDFADAGTATFDRERDLSIRNNIRDLIEQIDRALTRIDEGTYGTCERCGQPIDAARLKALPHASLCLDCKRRDERVR